jgi:catechol 2,3-dioxygenase-like lactoylglutathione lyase family enzyme
VERTIGWPMWIGVVAGDLSRQRDFYGSVCGLRELKGTRDWIHFDLGPEGLFEIIALDPDSAEYRDPGYRVGFEVADIRAAARELVERGAEPVTDVLGGPDSTNYWSYFRDAEGNLFELSQRV